MLKANGKTQRFSVKVNQGRKGVPGTRVQVATWISKTVTTGKNGVAVVSVKPNRRGSSGS